MIPKSGCRFSEKRSCSTKRSSDGSDSAKLDQTLVSATQGSDPLAPVCDEVDYGAHRREFDKVRMREQPEIRSRLVSVGDVGYLDEDGYLFLCDRKCDMVISGGVNIYPAEIENALIGMAGVRDCAVFGIPDDEFGERLCACIEPEPDAALSSAAVQQFLRGRLANFKVLKDIQFLDALPREASGKIFKRKLRDPYWEGRIRSGA
jgi:acyl-CoA synthetase (AMP-forming)/AMP-acid ligase II